MEVTREQRFYEIIPGALVWTTFILGVVLSFIQPLWIIYFIIMFDLFWLLRLIYFIIFLLMSWKRFRKETRVDWFERLRQISGWENKVHLIFYPTYGEPLEVLENTFANLAKVNYPLDKIMIVFGGEAREGQAFLEKARVIEEKYKNKFYKFMVTVHDIKPDEIPGKGSNLNFMGRKAKEAIDNMGINYDDAIVSSFDVDTVTHNQYFAYLTFLYMTVANPTRCSYQPVALFGNNIWEARSIIRISSFGTTFWLLAELARPERLWTFSSHSMSFKMLVDVGFWQKDIVTEDSRIFLQGLIRYHGDYRVVPMFLPVSMDAVSGITFWQAVKNLYKQQRRWAWGVEHFPHMAMHFRRDKIMRFRTKVKYLFNHIEGMYTWAVAPVIIFLLGYLPLFVAGEAARGQALFQNAPYTLEMLMRLAMIGILISAILGIRLLPPRPKVVPRHKYLIMLLQWALLPITFVVFGALPAIDAQTRLMLGGSKRLGFNVTAKQR